MKKLMLVIVLLLVSELTFSGDVRISARSTTAQLPSNNTTWWGEFSEWVSGATAKIVSVGNTIVDDLNGLIR